MYRNGVWGGGFTLIIGGKKFVGTLFGVKVLATVIPCKCLSQIDLWPKNHTHADLQTNIETPFFWTEKLDPL